MSESPLAVTSEANGSIWQKLQALSYNDPATWSKREALWKKAKSLGLPTLKNERYSGVKLRAIETFIETAQPNDTPLESLLIERQAPLGYADADLVVMDGECVYTSSNLKVMPLKQALNMNPLVSQRLIRQAQEEKDVWALINGALAHGALFARLNDGFKGRLKVYFLATEKRAFSTPKLTLWIGQQNQVEIDVFSQGDAAHLSVEAIELIVESDSTVNMAWSRREGKKALSLNFLRASLQKQVQFHFCDLCEGASVSRLDAHVQLTQEETKAELAGLALLQGQNQSQVNILVEHMAPSCESSQLFKNALKGSSKSAFQGKIYIHQKAQQTQAYQLNRNLILNDEAVAQSKPNLEIFADDVKASHGSTTGEVDPEALFYLLARGLDKETATNLLVHGFSMEILEHMTSESLKGIWKAKIDQF